MFAKIRTSCLTFLLAFGASFLPVLLFNFYVGPGTVAEDDVVWHVRKSSGDVWITTSGVQQASLTDESTLKPGEYIRTGQTGRAELVHGEESILISPNSVIGIPGEKKEGLSTRIIQQAGSILLEVEKRKVKHFEVETPYLAALVKGTQFRVSIDKNDTHVEVVRGEVEVSDFKSGQYVLVQPGQTAKVSAQGPGGLSVSGSGTLSPIQRGSPRKSSVNSVPVPQQGLSAPESASNGQKVRLVSPLGQVESISASSGANVAKEDVWTSSRVVSGKGDGHANGWLNSNDNVTLTLIFPFAVGVTVAVAAAVKRRRQTPRDR
jgi:FecR-like protein